MFVLALILLSIGLLLTLYLYLNIDTLIKGKNPDTYSAASVILLDNLKDPLVTSRAYFTEPLTGPTGDFVGYSPVSEDNWLHSFTHEETQDKRSEYDNIRSLI
jgi:hypothetical protein